MKWENDTPQKEKRNEENKTDCLIIQFWSMRLFIYCKTKSNLKQIHTTILYCITRTRACFSFNWLIPELKQEMLSLNICLFQGTKMQEKPPGRI